jgi:hypothetical protein
MLRRTGEYSEAKQVTAIVTPAIVYSRPFVTNCAGSRSANGRRHVCCCSRHWHQTDGFGFEREQRRRRSEYHALVFGDHDANPTAACAIPAA